MKKSLAPILTITGVLFAAEYIVGSFNPITPLFYAIILYIAFKTAQIITKDPRLVFKIFGAILFFAIWSTGASLYQSLQPSFHLGFAVKTPYVGPEPVTRYVSGPYELSVVANHLQVTNMTTKKWQVLEVRPLGCRSEEYNLEGIYYESGVLYTHITREWSGCMGRYKQKLKFDV